MEVKLEKLKAKEARWAAELIAFEFKKEPYKIKWAQDLEKTVREQVTRAPKLAFKITRNKKNAGIMLCRESLWEPAGKACFIEMLALESKFQGHGIGKKAMQLLEERLKKEEFAVLTLLSDPKTAAFGFYKSQGFKKSRWEFIEKELK